MTKKHYKLIAEVVKNSKKFLSDDSLECIIFGFSKALKEDNPSFSEEKFREYINKK